MTDRIARTSTKMLRAMADKAKGDPFMLIAMLHLSEIEGPKQKRRVDAALGISKQGRTELLEQMAVPSVH